MTDLSPSEQLKIANSGEQFDETGRNSWIGEKIRKGDKIGKVIRDTNGTQRILTVEFKDGDNKEILAQEIRLNNVGPDPKYVHDYEWFSEHGKKWYRF